MIRHLIWDWNGTLLDDVEACVGAINRMLDRRRLPGIDTPTYRRIFDFPVIRYYTQLGFDLDAEDWNAVAIEFHEHYGELARSATLRDGVIDVLDVLADAVAGMSVLSACEQTILERMLVEHGIRRRFGHVSGLDNLHASSKLENGRRLLETLDLPPHEIVLIGDTNHDHEVASALGIGCILLAGGHQSESRLLATDLVRSARDLPARLVRMGGNA
jgi:phosphoglycolate phosphatase